MSGFSGRTRLCVRSPRFIWKPLTLAERMDRLSMVLLVSGIIPGPDTVWWMSEALVWVGIQLSLDGLDRLND